MEEKLKSPQKPPSLKKLNVIKRLKEYKGHHLISSLLNDFRKRQEKDYFLIESNIRIGKINDINKYNTDKNMDSSSNSHQSPLKKKHTLRQSSFGKFKTNNSLSSTKIERLKNKESFNINKNHIIDNKLLKNYYNEIRQRISDEKAKNEEKTKILLEVPLGVRQSLINQENIFKKILKEKKDKIIMQKKIQKLCNKKFISDLLMNKTNNFDKKYQEFSIIEKNITEENRYKSNLWNITLRNIPYKGKYEKMGYINVGSNYHPMYTFFNINKNIEYFNNPYNARNKTEEFKNKNEKLFSSLNYENYNLKVKNNLNVLNSIENLEINGKNLLDVEDKRESEIKGKKIIYNTKDLDYLIFKNKDANPNSSKDINEREVKLLKDNIYEEKIFARNYKRRDFLRNENISSKYTNYSYN